MRLVRKKRNESPPTLLGDLSHAVRQEMAVAWFAPDGTLLDASNAFCALMGYDPADITGTTHDAFLDPSRTDEADLWDRLLSGRGAGGDALARRGRDGRTIWVGATYVPISGGDGDIRTILMFARDVSDRVRGAAEAQSRLDALDRSQARIEFDLDGTIRTANENFLKTVGYALSDLVGRHHSMLVGPAIAATPDYARFWQELAAGEFKAGEFRRFGKNEREIWLQATYNPILDSRGQPTGIIKIASDITQAKYDSFLSESRLRALDNSQAVIEFEPDGTIRTANANFLASVGYDLDEIRGRNHAMFMPSDVVGTPDYKAFWDRLRGGEAQAGDFRRIGKDGREVWLQATYNPIADTEGRVFRVVIFANDISASKRAILAFRQAVSRLAANDLAVRIEGPVPAEFRELKEEFNGSLAALSTVIAGISERTDRILSDAAQIDSAAADLSVRTERQAATLEETAAAVDQMAESVRTAAKNAGEAAHTSRSAEQSTASGLETVRRAIDAMTEIAASSERVSQITDVIDGLSFQTNLLALNAGVEAARAGDSGRGFAVVASEVRQLAQRSSEASQQIADLIRSTASQIQGGVKLVSDSGGALEQISQFVQDIRARVADLATAAQEQSHGLDDINTATGELDKVTQQNAAMFQETTAATQSLTREVQELSQSTRQFSLGSDAADAAEATGEWEVGRRGTG